MIEATSRMARVCGLMMAAAVLPMAGQTWAQGLQRDMPVGTGPSTSTPAPAAIAPPAAAPPAAPRPAAPPRPPAIGGKTAGAGGPEFRDPKTGQIWTPDNVGQDNKGPVAPEDRAFDPSGQAVAGGAIVDQHPKAQRLGTVPITAGPTVPLVELTNINLRAVPGDHWQIAVDLTNNSANTYVPVFVCNFDNGSKAVSRVRALAPTTGPGERMRLVVVGPATSLYVDKARCDLTTP